MIAIAVNCLATEPDSKMVSGVFGTACSRSAMPYAFINTGLPRTATPTAHPGVDVVQRENTASTAFSERAGCAAAGTANARVRISAQRIIMRASYYGGLDPQSTAQLYVSRALRARIQIGRASCRERVKIS